MEKKIFISHSSQDEDIVKEIEPFISNVIKGSSIFCSSIEGQGVTNGEKIEKRIYEEILKSKLILYVISQNFIKSEYCQQELGAGWILKEKGEVEIHLIKLPDIEHSDIKGFIENFKTTEINEDSLHEYIDDIKKYFRQTKIYQQKIINI